MTGPSVHLSLITKEGRRPLSKRIYLDEMGILRSDGSPCAMARGHARRIKLNGSPSTELARHIGAMPEHQALVLGDLRAGLPDEVRLDVKRRADPAYGTVARDRSTFGYREGAPAFALIDHDRKGMPEKVQERLAAIGGVEAALASVLPMLGGIATISRASTSSGLVHSVTGEPLTTAGGLHHYLLVADGVDIPRFLNALHRRLWLAGFGWMMIGGAGQLLERSLIDRTVGAPERLVFEGAPQVVPPLVQDAAARRPVAREGLALETRSACPDLSPRETEAYAQALLAARQAAAGEARAIRERWVETTAMTIAAEQAIDLDVARRAVGARHDGILVASDVVHFDDEELGRVAVADILANPARYDGETLADPLEGRAYGTSKAKLFCSPPSTGSGARDIVIHSFAHGGLTYRMRYDVATAAALIDEAGGQAVDQLVELLPQVHRLTPADHERLRNRAAAQAGVGKRAVDGTLKASREEQAAEAARNRAEAELSQLAAGGRAVLPLPAEDAELTPTVLAIDEALSASTLLDPVMRTLSSRCCRVEVRAPGFLHRLTSSGAEAQEAAVDRLPAPSEPLITPYSPIGLRLRIEREVAFHAVEPDGRVTVKALQPHFAAAFAEYHDSKLPLINGIVTAPMILPSGQVLTGHGFDAETGLYFHLDERLAGLVPHAGSVTDEDVRAAYSWLLDNLLPDVLCNDIGKAIAIAYTLTLIQRLVLDARPAFVITANQRGGGKTTLIHMLTLAVLGRMASASAWSPSAEERRKNLFAIFRDGVAAVNWDNIPRGEALSCPYVEAALTAATISDRVLGVSRRELVPATTVQSFTGNNILPRGDLASRTLLVELASERPDPENRTLVHNDPLAWVQANRGTIVRALYTLLLGNPQLGASWDQRPAETRFKAWWRLCGSAVEHAAKLHDPPSKLRFRDLFLATEEDDEEASGTADLLHALLKAYGQGSFTASELATKLTIHGLDEDVAAIVDGLARVTGTPLKQISALTIGQRLKAIKGRPALLGKQIMALQVDAKTKGGEQSRWRVRPCGGFEEAL